MTPHTPTDLPSDDISPLLDEPFASLWAQPAPSEPRGSLLNRVSRSLQGEVGLHTARRRRLARQRLAEGVSAQLLYQAEPGRPLRQGEPLRARLIEFAPGARLADAGCLPEAGAEWLVMRGELRLGAQVLALHDYLVQPAGAADGVVSEHGALVFVRESPARAGAQVHLVRDREAGWPEFAPGIRRRVLWTQGRQAALLYQVDPGASVPLHTHGHDEECLMVDGELFLDDLLLQAGDYQLAPVGTHHHLTLTETGGVLFGHGDLDLQFV